MQYSDGICGGSLIKKGGKDSYLQSNPLSKIPNTDSHILHFCTYFEVPQSNMLISSGISLF